MLDLNRLMDPDTLTDAELVDALKSVATDLDDTQAHLDGLYAARLRLYQSGRARTPAVTQRRLAEAAGCTEVAVIQALRKAAKASATT